MQVSKTQARIDLIKVFWVKDKNKDEQLDRSEVSEKVIKKYDKSGDG